MSATLDYQAFLEGKVQFGEARGLPLAPDVALNPALKPHTRDLVRWAVEGGRRAIFADFGLHKTATQLEIMRLIGAQVEGKRLIVLPLGVRQEFTRDARERFTGEFAVTLKFIRSADELEGDEPIYLTNYETVRDGKLDPNLFVAATLDEAAVLRSFGSKTYQTFLTLFEQVAYRFVATATPSPNRYKELIHYAGFLGIMDTGQALTRFFERDSEQANHLTLMPHMREEFFAWLHSWAIFLQSPSDLGYSDEGYVMPPLRVVWHEVPAAESGRRHDRDGQGAIVRDASLSLPDAATEKRESITARVSKAVEILAASPGEHAILWHHLEAERHALAAAVPTAVSVYGTQDLDERERAIIGFSDGEFAYLSTKPEIAGSGCNFQRHCRTHVFIGINDQFNDLFQAIHRLQRFGQTREVVAHFIITEAERGIRARFERKWAEHVALRAQMRELIRAHGLSATGLEAGLTRTIGVSRRAEIGAGFEVAHNDCVDETRRMADGAITGMILTSVPFGNHYEYSASINDFGHNPDHEAFFRQMDFLTPELHRALAPGRVLAVHVKDRIRFGNVTGYGFPTVEPFHADCIYHYRRHGFRYMGLIFVATDVVRENNQTYRLSWTEQCKDGAKMGVGSPEFILLFRKEPSDTSKGYADVPVVKSKADYSLARWQIDADSLWKSSGDRLLTMEELAQFGPEVLGKYYRAVTARTDYDYAAHVALGEALTARHRLPKTFKCLSPAVNRDDVWTDVVRMRTLNGQQSQQGLQQHICPLQLDIVERLIARYTNPGEIVYDPFGGLMTVPYVALTMGRVARAAELNADYFADGVRYLRSIEARSAQPTLLDLVDLPIADEEGTTL